MRAMPAARRNRSHRLSAQECGQRMPGALATSTARRRRKLLDRLGMHCLREERVGGAIVLGERRDLALGRLGTTHGAVTLEDHALLDDQARRRDVAEQLSWRLDLDALARRDVASDLALDDYGAAEDLRVDDRRLADDQRVLRGDL